MFASPVITRMAGGAFLAVLRVSVGDGLRIAGMACNTRRVATGVITRVINTGVTVGQCGYPGGIAMTGVTFLCCHKVGLSFSGCLCAIVTTATAARDIRVIKTGWYPGGCAMTVIACITAGNMILCFTRCCGAVMAAITGAG